MVVTKSKPQHILDLFYFVKCIGEWTILNPMSGLKPHLWKSCSRGLRVFLFFHCWTISMLTLYSPLQFGWKTRLRRPSIASGESLICPGLGFSAVSSDKSGIPSRGSLPSPVLEGVGVTRLASLAWVPTTLAVPVGAVGEIHQIHPELFDGYDVGYEHVTHYSTTLFIWRFTPPKSKTIMP